jgi:hypothetical protein
MLVNWRGDNEVVGEYKFVSRLDRVFGDAGQLSNEGVKFAAVEVVSNFASEVLGAVFFGSRIYTGLAGPRDVLPDVARIIPKRLAKDALIMLTAAFG